MKKHIVFLSSSELILVKSLICQGSDLPSIRNRAHALYLSHIGKTDDEISSILFMTTRTICNIRKNYCNDGFDRAVYGKKSPGRPRKFDMTDEAELTALACSEAPSGRSRWTLDLLKQSMTKDIGKSTVHLMLKKTAASRGNKRCGV